jgi:cytoskeleton protein RodZ
MSENAPSEEMQEAPIGNTAGAMLKEAREAAGLSIEEVANELHLVSDVVDALENGNKEKLPSRVFTLGYLKNYAKLVDIPFEQIKSAYDDFAEEDIPVLNQPRAPEIRQQVKSSNWLIKSITWLLILGLILLLFLWWKGDVNIPGLDTDFPFGLNSQQRPVEQLVNDQQQELSVTLDQETNQQILVPLNTVETARLDQAVPPEVTTQPAEPAPAVSNESIADTGETVLPSPSADESATPVPQAPETSGTEVVPAVSVFEVQTETVSAESFEIPLETGTRPESVLTGLPPIAPVENRLESIAPVETTATETSEKIMEGSAIQISFSGRCWVQVTDSTGKVILSGEMKAGESRSIDGVAPFRFVFGNAKAVELQVDNQVFDLTPYTSGNVARFTLEVQEG